MPATQADTWRVKALAATAVAAVREIQALQAPHIAESDDAAMTRIEKRMTAAEGVARNELEMLAGLVAPGSRAQLAAASTALDRFVDLNTQLIALSRRNTNVRSLALSLGQKRMLTAACEDSLARSRTRLWPSEASLPRGRDSRDLSSSRGSMAAIAALDGDARTSCRRSAR